MSPEPLNKVSLHKRAWEHPSEHSRYSAQDTMRWIVDPICAGLHSLSHARRQGKGFGSFRRWCVGVPCAINKFEVLGVARFTLVPDNSHHPARLEVTLAQNTRHTSHSTGCTAYCTYQLYTFGVSAGARRRANRLPIVTVK